jgi:TonB family protein
LRPSSRTIPRAIDARFQGRYVYTMVIPIENMPDYTGDWILWFAECQQQPGDSPMMRAPIPFRKQELVESSPVNPVERRLQLAAVIRKDGRIDGISVLRSAGPSLDQGMIQDMASWQFKPATRDGIPVDVDVVMEIPFNLSSAIAKRAQP